MELKEVAGCHLGDKMDAIEISRKLKTLQSTQWKREGKNISTSYDGLEILMQSTFKQRTSYVETGLDSREAVSQGIDTISLTITDSASRTQIVSYREEYEGFTTPNPQSYPITSLYNQLDAQIKADEKNRQEQRRHEIVSSGIRKLGLLGA